MIEIFLGYNQIPIAKEDQEKTTFVCEFGSLAYIVMPFGLKNALVVFSIIVINAFQEYLYRTMVVYLNDWIIYSLLKEQVKWLHLMLKCCIQIKLALCIKKGIFSTSIGIILRHVACKEGIKVYLAKVKVILDLKPPTNLKQVRSFFRHTRYFRKFIRHYSNINFPIEELLSVNITFIWIK